MSRTGLGPATLRQRKAELEADVRVDAFFDEALDALSAPVKFEYVDEPNKH